MGDNVFLFNTPRDIKICQKVAYPITESDFKLEKVIAKEYECPVCLNFSSPPIMMCINSHLICFDCWKRCTNCPTCRAAKSLTRAFVLERIHPLINFPCKWDQCPFIANASYTGIHEHLCKYYPLKCPLGDTHQCSWIGTMKNVQQHLKDNHKNNVYFDSSVNLVSRRFTKGPRKDYTIIFVVNDRLFKFYWNYDTSISQKVKFGMVSVGNGNPVVIYTYTLMFARTFPINRDCRKLKMVKAAVKKSFTDCSLINRSPHLQNNKIINHELNFADLAAFCNHGDLTYQVIIDTGHMARCSKLTNRLTPN